MKLNKKGFSPSMKPLWRKRLESILLYITDLEQCLDAANIRIAEQDAELERLRGNCGYPRCTKETGK
jgi:hypothetical protein